MESNKIGLIAGKKHIVTLSGYISGLSEKLDHALATYMVAYHDQSYCWGEIPGLSRAIQSSGTSLAMLLTTIKYDLEKILAPKFNMVRVEVDEDPEYVGAALTKVNIVIDIQDSGYYEKSARILEMSDGKFKRLIKLHTTI